MLIQERNHILVYKVLRYSHSHSILKITKELIQEISHFSVNNVPRHFLLQLTLRLTKELIQDRDHIIVKIVPKYFLTQMSFKKQPRTCKPHYRLKFPTNLSHFWEKGWSYSGLLSVSFSILKLTMGWNFQRKFLRPVKVLSVNYLRQVLNVTVNIVNIYAFTTIWEGLWLWLSLWHAYVDPWDMENNFCFHV